MLEVFPDLIGQSIEVSMTPEFDNRTAVSVSGKEVSTAFREFPVWKLEVSFGYLPNSDVKPHLSRIQGFFLRMRGNFSPFLFRVPEQDYANNVLLGEGDGETVEFTLLRDTDGFLEPVGSVDPECVPEMLLDNVLVPSSGFSVSGTTVTFVTPPGEGVQVRGNYKYLFLCKFEESSTKFDRFMWQLWEAKSVSLRSLIQ